MYVCMYVCMCIYMCLHVGTHTYIQTTAIPIIIEGQFQAFQRFSSSKLVLKAVENRSAALSYYGIGSSRVEAANLISIWEPACMYVCMYVYMSVYLYMVACRNTYIYIN
jgi:hypothetical protein